MLLHQMRKFTPFKIIQNNYENVSCLPHEGFVEFSIKFMNESVETIF